VHGRNGVYGGNVEIIAIREICKASVAGYLVSEGKITQVLTAVAHPFVTDRNVSLFV
jgi:hypothetical protein